MPENATPDESVQIIIPPDTVVDADNPLPVTVVAGSGSAAVTIADGADVAQGAKADAAWNGTPGSTTIMAVLKAIYAKVAATLGFSVNAGTTDATTLRVITASDGPLNTNLGATTDAVVTGDANGSVSGKIRYLGKVFADLWDTTNHALYVRFKTGSTITAVAAGTSNTAITGAAGRLHGFSLRETTGTAAALVYLRDGTSTADTIVTVISLLAGESARDYFGDRGLAIGTGIYLHRSSGNVEGAIYSGPA